MKKFTLILALVLMASVVSAQTINVQSAIEQQNRGYYKKAVEFIDKACKHEQTAGQAKTWYWRTMIYFKIGKEITDNTKKGKELMSVAPYWYRECKESALTWQKLDTKGEYTEAITPMISYIGMYYSDLGYKALREKKYEECIAFCDTAIMLNGISGKEYLAQSYYFRANASLSLDDKEGAKKYLSLITRSGNKTYTQAYETLYQIYVDEKDTVNAVKTATTYAKIAPDTNYNAAMLASKAYRLNGNIEKSQEYMNKALSNVRNDKDKAILLCAIGASHEDAQDYAEAEKCYKESLTLEPNQFIANNSMGLMYYNRAVDKLNAANDVDIDDETGLFDQLTNEYKELFRQCIEYCKNGVSYIDNLPTEQQANLQGSLHNCLMALKTAYLRLEMNEEFTAVNARLLQIEAAH